MYSHQKNLIIDVVDYWNTKCQMEILSVVQLMRTRLQRKASAASDVLVPNMNVS